MLPERGSDLADHVGIRVRRMHDVQPRKAVGELTNGCADSANGLSPVLAAVHRHLRSPVRLPAPKLHCDELSSNSTGTAPASQDNGGGNGDHRKVVPNGTYVLKLRVLKALGDESDPADWETYTSPPITLARP